MNKLIISSLLTVFLLPACTQQEETPPNNDWEGTVCFTSHIGAAASRATDTAFDNGDQISVFAFKDATGFQMENVYVTNKKYAYRNQFTTIDANNAIVYPEDKGALSFQAIYPYLESAGASFTFHVKEDQSVAGNYTQSDLMTASTIATTELTPHLKFGHRLTNVMVNLTFDQTPAGTIKVEFQQVTTAAAVDMVTATFKSTGDQAKTVRAAAYATNSYRAILPPQTMEANAALAIITTEAGDTYTWKMPKKETWKSGIQYVYNLHISKEGEVTFTSEIDPWGESGVKKRLSQVVYGDGEVKTLTYAGEKLVACNDDHSNYDWNITYAKNQITLNGIDKSNQYNNIQMNVNLDNQDNAVSATETYRGATIAWTFTYTDGYIANMTRGENERWNMTYVAGNITSFYYQNPDGRIESATTVSGNKGNIAGIILPDENWLDNSTEVLYYCGALGKATKNLLEEVTWDEESIYPISYELDDEGYPVGITKKENNAIYSTYRLTFID